MSPSTLKDITHHVVLEIASQCNETNRYAWRKYWQMISELPATLKVRLFESLAKRELICDDNICYLINSQITRLCLYNCLKSDFTIEMITKHCHRMTHLDLGARIPNMNLVSSESLALMFEVCPHLEYIKLDNCINVNDRVVSSIVYHIKYVKILRLSGCLSITDKALKLIADNCKYLIALDVSRTMVGDDGLCYFARGICANDISELLVNNCSYVSNISIGQLIKCCSKLQIFCFNGTRATMQSLYEVITRPLHIQFDI